MACRHDPKRSASVERHPRRRQHSLCPLDYPPAPAPHVARSDRVYGSESRFSCSDRSIPTLSSSKTSAYSVRDSRDAFLARSEFVRFGQIGVPAGFVARRFLGRAAIAECIAILRIQLDRLIEIRDGLGVEL